MLSNDLTSFIGFSPKDMDTSIVFSKDVKKYNSESGVITPIIHV